MPDPAALLIGPAELWLASVLAALGVAVVEARRAGLDPRVAYWGGLVVLAAGLVGGHVVFLAAHGAEDGDAWRWLRIWGAGKSTFGFVAGAAGAALLLRARSIGLAEYGDVGAPALALGYAIARVGCFLNGDDFGIASGLPWAVAYPRGTEAYQAHLERAWIAAEADESLGLVPVQLFAAMLGAVLVAVLLRMKRSRPGMRLAVLCVGYGTGRFSLEFLRDDRLMLGSWSASQLCALALVAAGCVVWSRAHHAARPIAGLREARRAG